MPDFQEVMLQRKGIVKVSTATVERKDKIGMGQEKNKCKENNKKGKRPRTQSLFIRKNKNLGKKTQTNKPQN